jgi:hypothetical protein
VRQPRITQRSVQTIRRLSIEAIGDAATSISITQMSGSMSRHCAVRPQCRCEGRNAIVNPWVGITSCAATVSRVMLVIWLVFFSVYDAPAGVGTGVLVMQAAGTAGNEQAHFGARAEFVWDSRWTGTMASWGVVGRRGDSCLAGRRQHGCDRAAPSRRTLANDSGVAVSVLIAVHGGVPATIGFAAPASAAAAVLRRQLTPAHQPAPATVP